MRWDIDFDMCDQNIAIGGPDCPTAAGVLELSGKTNFTLTITTSKDGAVELAQKVKMAATVKLRGQTADDAKLDYVDVEATYRTDYSSGRQSILWGPSSERGTVVRKTRIDMRTGRYDTGQASAVDIQVSYSGVLSLFVQNTAAQARVAAELKKASDRQFARTISTTIEEYRERETKWQTPNTCATLTFTPPSNSLRVKKGDTGRSRAASRRNGVMGIRSDAGRSARSRASRSDPREQRRETRRSPTASLATASRSSAHACAPPPRRASPAKRGRSPSRGPMSFHRGPGPGARRTCTPSGRDPQGERHLGRQGDAHADRRQEFLAIPGQDRNHHVERDGLRRELQLEDRGVAEGDEVRPLHGDRDARVGRLEGV